MALLLFLAEPAMVCVAGERTCEKAPPPGGWPEPLDRGAPQRTNLLLAASKHFQFEEFDKALAKYEAVLSNDSTDSAALLGRAEIHRGRGDDASALRDFDLAFATVKPTWHADQFCAEAELGRGRIALHRGSYDIAVKQFSAVIYRDRALYAAAYSGRAEALLGIGKPADALADAERAIWLSAYDASAYRTRARVYAALAQSSEALDDTVRAGVLETYDDVVKIAYRSHREKDTDATLEWISPEFPGRPTIAHRRNLYAAPATSCSDEARNVLTVAMTNGVVVVRPLYAGRKGEIRAASPADDLFFVVGDAGCRVAVTIRKPVHPTNANRQIDLPPTETVSRNTTPRFERAFYPTLTASHRDQCDTAVIVLRAFWGVVEISDDRSMSPRALTDGDAPAIPNMALPIGSAGCELEIAIDKFD